MLKRSLEVSLKTMSVLGMSISQEMDTSLVSSLLSRLTTIKENGRDLYDMPYLFWGQFYVENQ
jgi:hypothetical protein